MSAPQIPPGPLEWHPAYRDQTWLLNWLEGRGDRPTHHIRLPIVPVVRLKNYDREPDAAEVLHERVLAKRRAWGAAPYVGRPFRYWWYFAADELGRAIAGDARIRYASEDFTFCYGSFEYAQDARNGHDPDTPVWP